MKVAGLSLELRLRVFFYVYIFCKFVRPHEKKKSPLLASVFEQKFKPYEKTQSSSLVFLDKNFKISKLNRIFFRFKNMTSPFFQIQINLSYLNLI